MKSIIAKITSVLIITLFVFIGCENPLQSDKENTTEMVEKPTLSPQAGEYTTDQEITISTETEGATIYYTVDGSDPDDNSSEYTDPITITEGTTTIKAIAIKNGMYDSTVVEATYTINYGQVSTTPFITIWKTDQLDVAYPGILDEPMYVSASNQVKLPLDPDGTYDFTVEWGDETSDTITSYNQPEVTHSYAQPGTYTITIVGTCNGFGFSEPFNNEFSQDHSKLIDVEKWGAMRFHNKGWQLNNLPNLETFSADDTPNLSNITDMSYMFAGTRNFNDDLSGWDVSSVDKMTSMFKDANAFNGDITQWDTSGAQWMDGMFESADRFNRDISGWNTSSVKVFNGMFLRTLDFNQDISSWNTSAAMYMNFMFEQASSFTCGPISPSVWNWDTSSIVSMKDTFTSSPLQSTPPAWYRNLIRGISIDQEPFLLLSGETADLTVSYTTVTGNPPEDPAIQWTSSNEAFLAVNANGKVTGHEQGEAAVTVQSEDGQYQDSIEITVYDENPPAEVSDFNAQGYDTYADISWINPSDDDFDHVELSWSSTQDSGSVEVAAETTDYLISGMTNDIQYTIILKTVDVYGYISSGISTTVTPVDEVPPAEVELTSGTESDSSFTVNWNDPSDTDFDEVSVRYFLNGSEQGQSAVSPGMENFTFNDLTEDTKYRVLIQTIDQKGNISDGISFHIAVHSERPIGSKGPANGFIFYDDEADGEDNIFGLRYLEVSDTTFETTAAWGPADVGAPEARDTTLGAGEGNTAAIIDALGNSATYAAKICNEYVQEGFADWFLPSIDELILMVEKKATIGGMERFKMWSSSENSISHASVYERAGDTIMSCQKDVSTFYIRAIRSF